MENNYTFGVVLSIFITVEYCMEVVSAEWMYFILTNGVGGGVKDIMQRH